MRPSVTKKGAAKRTSKDTSLEKSSMSMVFNVLKVVFKSIILSVWWMLKTPLALLSLVFAVLIVLAIANDVPQKIYHFTEEQLAHLAVKADVQLENVYLEGQEYTKTEAILKQMDVQIGMPLFAIDLDIIRSKLEALPWVRYAEVERQYPSTLTVRIIEREPVALWQLDGELSLLDSQGLVIKVDDISQFSDYLILVGKGVPYYMTEVMEMLEAEPTLKPLVSSMVRVSDRRWDVILRNDIRIMLPEKQPERMWSYVAQIHEEKDILSDYDIESINLKIPEKIFIERTSEKNKNNSSKHEKNT